MCVEKKPGGVIHRADMICDVQEAFRHRDCNRCKKLHEARAIIVVTHLDQEAWSHRVTLGSINRKQNQEASSHQVLENMYQHVNHCHDNEVSNKQVALPRES